MEGSSDGGASGEGDQGKCWILNKVGDVLIWARDHVKQAGGKAGSLGDLGEVESGEGGFGGGLEDDGAAACDGRSEFVGDEIEGKVEGREGGDGAEREASGDALVMCAGGGGIQVQPSAALMASLLGGDAEGGEGSLDFEASQLDGFSDLDAEELSEGLAVLLEKVGDLQQKSGAFVGGLMTAPCEG